MKDIDVLIVQAWLALTEDNILWYLVNVIMMLLLLRVEDVPLVIKVHIKQKKM